MPMPPVAGPGVASGHCVGVAEADALRVSASRSSVRTDVEGGRSLDSALASAAVVCSEATSPVLLGVTLGRLPVKVCIDIFVDGTPPSLSPPVPLHDALHACLCACAKPPWKTNTIW